MLADTTNLSIDELEPFLESEKPVDKEMEIINENILNDFDLKKNKNHNLLNKNDDSLIQQTA